MRSSAERNADKNPGKYDRRGIRPHRSATEGYYAVLLHELTHWSGAASRCARDLTGRFDKQAYAMEELVAELGAAFLCADLGLSNTPRGDHAAYIASWLAVLKNDKKAIFTAAARAAEAAGSLQARQAEEGQVAA